MVLYTLLGQKKRHTPYTHAYAGRYRLPELQPLGEVWGPVLLAGRITDCALAKRYLVHHRHLAGSSDSYHGCIIARWSWCISSSDSICLVVVWKCPGDGSNRTDPYEAWKGTGSNQTRPNKTEPNRTEPNRTEPNRTEPNRIEPNRTEPNWTELNRTEPNRTKPNRTTG